MTIIVGIVTLWCLRCVELSIRPDLNDRLIPSHVEHGDNSEMSPDSTGIDQLTEDVNNTLNVHDSHSSGLVGKFRSSLKKKISIKGVSGLVKTPPRPAPRKTKDEGEDKERTEEEEGEERSPELEKSENVDDIEIEQSGEEIQELHETVETTPHSVEEDVEVKKKKKKKKRRPREEEVEQQEMEVVESTPVKSGGVKLPDFEESPVVTVETMETEEISYEVSSSGKTKKTKRKTHKKRTQQIEDDDEQVF